VPQKQTVPTSPERESRDKGETAV